MANQTWAQFNRFRATDSFFGVVDKEGNWIDSAIQYSSAVALACMFVGEEPMTYPEINKVLVEHKLSIIHSDVLKLMYEAGVLK